MTTETMSIHRALAEIKMLDKRLDNNLEAATFVSYSTKGSPNINGIKKGDFIKTMEAEYQQLCDLNDRKNALVVAVQQSNAVTEVTIAGKKYTVAQAIAKKNNEMNWKQDMLDDMVNQFANAQARVNNSNATLENRANQRLQVVFTNVTTADPEQVKQVKDSFIESETAYIVDPLNISEKITALRNEIDSFISEVDAVLSESNAVTQITVTY